MSKSKRKIITLTLCAFALLISMVLCGCSTLRLAPSESQKQIALKTHLNARAIDAQGAQPASPAAKQVAEGTQVALDYAGMPANLNIADYDATLQQAASDAVKRPTSEQVFESVEGGLSLAAELAILFGVGGAGFGGKKLIDWIKLAREKSKALKEIVDGNEQLKERVDAAAFKLAHRSQSATTKRIVTELKTT